MITDLYASAKLGPMKIAAFNGSAGTHRYWKITIPSNRDSALFALRGTVPVRVLQQAQSTKAASTPASATNATYLAANVHYPLLVESSEDNSISILGGTATAGNLEISLISDTVDWTLTEITV